MKKNCIVNIVLKSSDFNKGHDKKNFLEQFTFYKLDLFSLSTILNLAPIGCVYAPSSAREKVIWLPAAGSATHLGA